MRGEGVSVSAIRCVILLAVWYGRGMVCKSVSVIRCVVFRGAGSLLAVWYGRGMVNQSASLDVWYSGGRDHC